jgi:hypothetical protein
MFEGYRVVAVTPAGRRRYMEVLVPQILACPLVDRYDIWVNTDDPGDRAFFEGLAARYDRVRLVPLIEGIRPGVTSIHSFHRTTLDPGEVYIRFDDDIVWLEPGFFETLLRYRIDHPEHFLVTPLVINNALCSNLMQSLGQIVPWRHIHTTCFDRIGWGQPEFALALHRLFLGLIDRGETHKLHSGAHVIGLNRFSINCISYFGRDMALFGGLMSTEEEEDLSAVIPARLRRTNAICADTIVAHFAFFTQRAWMDPSGALERYAGLLRARPELAALRDEMAEIRRLADYRAPGVAAEGGVKVRSRVNLRHWRQIALRFMTGRYKIRKELNRVWVKPGPAL